MLLCGCARGIWQLYLVDSSISLFESQGYLCTWSDGETWASSSYIMATLQAVPGYPITTVMCGIQIMTASRMGLQQDEPVIHMYHLN